MKKNFLFLGTIACALFLGSCMGGNKNNTAAEIGMTEQDARGIISYYDLSLSQLKYLVNEREINVMLDLMNQRGANPQAPAVTPYAISASDSTLLMNPDSCFNQATRQSLKENYQGMFNDRILFYGNYDTYKKYIDSKGYLKDNYATAAKLLDANYTLSVQLAEFKMVIFDELSFVTSVAEKLVWADNPLKEQLMAEKSMTLTMQKIVNLCAAQKIDESKLDKETDVLRKQYDEARKLPAVTGQEKEMKKFGNFLSKTDLFLKALDKMKQDKTYSNEQYETLNSAFETSID